MENPIFKLEGVVKTKGVMEDFEGPLNLILQLLSKNKIEIKDISISLILEQYLAYLDNMASMDLEVASEFVSMASYLVYIKTKTLLAGDEDVSELEQLISSLEELRHRDKYVQIKSVTGALAEMYQRGSGLLVKPPEYIKPDTEYKYQHSAEDLAAVIRGMLDKEVLKTVQAMKAVVYPKKITYSVTEKASRILQLLKEFGVMRVEAIFAEAMSRSETVATFVAVLELCKIGRICLAGTEDELTISYTGTGSDDLVLDLDLEMER
jgi:segregation and condensation protein A